MNQTFLELAFDPATTSGYELLCILFNGDPRPQLCQQSIPAMGTE